MSIGNAAPGMEELPPTYAAYALPPGNEAPSYSQTPRHSEVTIRSVSDLDSCISGEKYIYQSKHLELDLGPKLWGTKAPAYGFDATVEGRLSLSGVLKKVSRIVIELEGRLTTTFWERGLAVGASTAVILSSSSSITPPSIADGTRFEHEFSMPFPTYSDGRRTKLPSSTIMYLPGVTCEVKYRLKVKVVRHGLHRRNESVKVALLYLPRSYAKQNIPFSIDQSSVPSSSERREWNSDIQIIRLHPKQRSDHKQSVDNPIIDLSLPSSPSFAYHEAVPFRLTINSNSGSAVNALLLSSAKLGLFKRNYFWKKNQLIKQEIRVGAADSLRQDSQSSVECSLSGKLRISCQTDAHHTWSVERLAGKEYFIRVSIQPPTSTAAHLPSYEYERIVEVTTDAYDSLEREATSLSGISSPALSSLAAARHNVQLQSANTTYLAPR